MPKATATFEMATSTIFVYGTLKRGLPNHDLLAGQQFLGEARTAPHYRLYDCGPYPALVPDLQRGVAVRGELWRVDELTLARLDELEEVPYLFIRRVLDVDCLPTPVFAYFYQGEVSGLTDCGACWPIVP